MRHPFTVYFDTNFFVWLGKAEEALAIDVINDLNLLEVRHVLSDVLIRELLTNGNRPDFDELLVERVNRFHLDPYCTNQDLTWEGLRPSVAGSALRFAVGDLLKTLDIMSTEANSYALTANRIADGRLSPEQLTEIEKSTGPFLEQLGLSLDPESKEQNLEAFHVFAEKIVDIARNALPEGSISGDLKWANDPMEDSKRLLGLLDPKRIEAANESNLLKESITYSEDRPYKVAAGIAEKGTHRNLAHSLRDSEHMSTFILHRNEIDALQIDKAQMNLIRRAKPRHRLVELSLSEKCFSVASLEEVVQAIRTISPHSSF